MALLRTISGRVRSFRALENAVKHHGERIAAILDERFNSILPDNLKVNFFFLMLAVIEILRSTCDTLTGREHVLVAERGNDTKMRNERDDDANALRSEMQGFRDVFEKNYQPADVEEFGFPPLLGRTPLDLLRQGDHLVQILGQPDVSVPESKFGAELPVPDLVAKVKNLADKLRASLAGAERERKMAEVAQVEKNRAQDHWDVLFLWGARIVSGLFVWAGETELAERIVPSTRRPGRTEDVAREETEGESESDGTAAGEDNAGETGAPDATADPAP
jgi:hypothetical protein